MSSRRRTIAKLSTVAKLKQHKKYPDRLWLELGFGDGKGKFWGFFPLRAIPTESLEMAIKTWLAPAYEAAMAGEEDPYTCKLFEEEHVRLALDLVYKELARRAEKL